MLYDFVNSSTGIEADEDSLGVYRRRLSDGETARTTLRGDRRTYTVSADGRFLAWVEFTDASTTLFAARPESLRSQRRIVSTREYISSVLWSSDGSGTLFYVVAPRAEEDGLERLYSARIDATGKRLVATLGAIEVGTYEYRTLLAHNGGRNEIAWFLEAREGAGGSRGLFVTDITTGKTRSRGLSQGREYHATAITADASKLYIVRDRTRLIERSVFTDAERIIYRAKGPTEVALEHLEITPDGSVLIFQATQDPFTRSSSNTDRPRTTTYRVRLPDGTPSAVNVEYKRNSHMTSDGVSPDGNYILLRDANSDGNVILLDVAMRRRTTIAEGRKNRTAFLVGWIALPA